ncbi:MAG: hypothetical protein V3T64_15880 [Myxococcota bacterium]
MSEPKIARLACFEAFRWPLPLAFAAAVAASRFEQGDVLYRDPRAFDGLSGTLPAGLAAIQVLQPPRSARGTPLQGEGDRRRSNWQSEVCVALIDLVSGESEQRVLSQGKLLMALWKGDEDWLEPDRDEPEFPKTARTLHANLTQALPVFSDHASRIRIRSGSQFILVVDLAHDASRAKAASVEKQLGAAGKLDVLDLLPTAAGVEHAEGYHPTLILRGFTLQDRNLEQVEALLRSCLYQGGASNQAGRQGREADVAASSGDRFSVGRHGLLVTI